MSLAELYNKADYKDKSGMLFNDDCMNVLSQIDNESIDLIVTDVPYPTTQRGNSGNSGGGNSGADVGKDSPIRLVSSPEGLSWD